MGITVTFHSSVCFGQIYLQTNLIFQKTKPLNFSEQQKRDSVRAEMLSGQMVHKT